MKIKAETKEIILSVVFGLLILAYTTAVVGWVFSQEPPSRPLHAYVVNSTEK